VRSWLLLGATVLALGLGALLGLRWLVSSFVGESRHLQDFSSPEQARDFLGGHLPVRLPKDARVEALTYERFTDWSLTARVRFPSGEAAVDYVERVKRERRLDDSYCGDSEPNSGARYALPHLFACGTVSAAATPESLDIVCQTR
jgi:hypothetical protein